MKLRNRKFILLSAGILVVIVLGVGIFLMEGVTQVKRMKTGDRMGMIWVALNQTLPDHGPLVDYDVTEQTKTLFPEIQIIDEKIVDAWKRPIGVFIEAVTDGFHVLIISAGQDGKFNTADDMVNKGVIKYRADKH